MRSSAFRNKRAEKVFLFFTETIYLFYNPADIKKNLHQHKIFFRVCKKSSKSIKNRKNKVQNGLKQCLMLKNCLTLPSTYRARIGCGDDMFN